MVSCGYVRTPRTPQSPDGGRYDHAVQFHDSDTALVEHLAEFVRHSLTAGEPAIVIVTDDHRQQLVERLRRDGVSADDLTRTRRLRFIDAHELLATIRVGGRFDRARFAAAADAVVADLRREGDEVALRAGGEAVDVLWRQGHRDAAMELESLWNDYAASRRITLLCTYALESFTTDAGLDIGDVCRLHTHVLSST